MTIVISAGVAYILVNNLTKEETKSAAVVQTLDDIVKHIEDFFREPSRLVNYLLTTSGMFI